MTPVIQVLEGFTLSHWGRLASRLGLGGIMLLISILFPGFIEMVSFVGVYFSFFITLIFPSYCHLALFKDGSGRWVNYFVIVLGVLGAFLGSLPVDRVFK